MTNDDTLSVIIDIVAQVTKRSPDDLSQQCDAHFSDELDMTSVQFFPILADIEECFDIDIDYSEFLAKVTSINTCTAYLTERFSV